MKLALSAPRSKAKIGLTPLIDVVFILLLFFMLTSTFAERRTMQLSTPSQAASAADADTEIVRIGITADGLSIDGQPVGADALGMALNERAGPADGVIIEAGPDIPLENTVAVMDAVRAAGLGPLSLVRAEASE